MCSLSSSTACVTFRRAKVSTCTLARVILSWDSLRSLRGPHLLFVGVKSLMKRSDLLISLFHLLLCLVILPLQRVGSTERWCRPLRPSPVACWSSALDFLFSSSRMDNLFLRASSSSSSISTSFFQHSRSLRTVTSACLLVNLGRRGELARCGGHLCWLSGCQLR